MKKLYLIVYYNENEQENDADVIVIDDGEHRGDAFKVFFKKTYGYDIKNEHVIDVYPVIEVFDNQGSKYHLNLKEA